MRINKMYFIKEIHFIDVHLLICYIIDINIPQHTVMKHVKISTICHKLPEFLILPSFSILQFLTL